VVRVTTGGVLTVIAGSGGCGSATPGNPTRVGYPYAIARHNGDPTGQAHALTDLGVAHARLGRYGPVKRHIRGVGRPGEEEVGNRIGRNERQAFGTGAEKDDNERPESETSDFKSRIEAEGPVPAGR